MSFGLCTGQFWPKQSIGHLFMNIKFCDAASVPLATQDVTIFIDFSFKAICHHAWCKTINFTNIGISKGLPDSNTEFYQIIHM